MFSFRAQLSWQVFAILAVTLNSCGHDSEVVNPGQPPVVATPTPVAAPLTGTTPLPQATAQATAAPVQTAAPVGTVPPPPLALPPAFGDSEGTFSHRKVYATKIEWIEPPKVNREAILVLHFADGKKRMPHHVDSVTLNPWLKSKGRSASTKTLRITEDKKTKGRFVVTGLFLPEAGEWKLLLSATVDGTSDLLDYAIHLPH